MLDVWQVWQQAAGEYSTRRAVGFVPGYGVFDMRHGVVYRLFGGTRNELSTARPATAGELLELDWSAAHGCLQIEVRPVTGVFRGQGGFGVSSAQETTICLWQAKGIAND